MKNVIRISLLCVMLATSGCATWHKLRDRIDDWAGYETPQQSEPEPSEPEQSEPDPAEPTRSERVTATVTDGRTRIEIDGYDGRRGELVATGRHDQVQAVSRFADGAIVFDYALSAIGPDNMVLRVGENTHRIAVK